MSQPSACEPVETIRSSEQAESHEQHGLGESRVPVSQNVLVPFPIHLMDRFDTWQASALLSTERIFCASRSPG
jgi:hypothetical protein